MEENNYKPAQSRIEITVKSTKPYGTVIYYSNDSCRSFYDRSDNTIIETDQLNEIAKLCSNLDKAYVSYHVIPMHNSHMWKCTYIITPDVYHNIEFITYCDTSLMAITENSEIFSDFLLIYNKNTKIN